MPTKIEWATETWNPISGCSPVSEGCQNCYARRMAQRLRGRFGYPQDDPFKVTFHPDRLDQPLKWRKPRMIFVSSMGDLFHKDIESEWVDEVLQVIAETNHTYMILTKRPENMKAYFDSYLAHEIVLPDNLWLGCTAENQQRADERIPILLQIPAARRFVSLEPLLSSIDLTDIELTASIRLDALRGGGNIPGLDWVIVGGETGPGARLMNPYWARAVLLRCQGAGVPFFFKNMSQKKPTPDDLMIREYPEGRPTCTKFEEGKT